MKKVLTYSDFLNESEQSSIEKYNDLLKKHDWYFQMSDDDRVYDKGMKEKDEIRSAFSSLSDEDKKKGFETWKELYKKHYPESDYKIEFEKFKGI